MLYISLVVLVIFEKSVAWNLNIYGIQNDYYVSSLAFYRNRVFLALPRTVCGNNITNPTAVEVSWTEETSSHLRKKLFHLDTQKWGSECKDLQSAISMDMEPRKNKLWVLDKGNNFCDPKIISYNLFHNKISQTCDLEKVPKNNLNTFVIDPVIGEYGPRAYIGDAGDNSIIVFSLNQLKWWRLLLKEVNNPSLPIFGNFLSVSKTDESLFISGKNSVNVYSLNLTEVRDVEGPLTIEAEDVIIEKNVTFLGQKLGLSSGLVADSKGGLNYFLTKDYAIVRWEIGTPMKAENHNVLAQSYELLPFVTQLFVGQHEGLWALVNPLSPEDCIFRNETEEFEKDAKVLDRVLKIVKFNKY